MLKAGDKHYKAYVGPPSKYNLVAANQFNLLTLLGLRGRHKLLDIGCGSLRGGRLFIPYLDKNRYFGTEPNTWLVNKGIEKELGKDMLKLKKPRFDHNGEFKLSVFNTKFDFLLAQSIFSHASRTQIKNCLKEARQVMKNNSIFAATFLVGSSNHKGSKWTYPSCVTYTPRYINKMANMCSLKCQKITWPHPNKQTWFIFTHIGQKAILPIFPDEIILNELNKELSDKERKLNIITQKPLISLLHKPYTVLKNIINNL
jgi:SAM-dependent methyltransferase